MALTAFPDQRRLLLADRSLAAPAAGEILRYDPPSQLLGRLTSRDVTLEGVTIPAGEKVRLVTGSAPRDEPAAESPDGFDLHRVEHPSTLVFGFGIHRCFAAHLARLEITVAMQDILDRFPDFATESRAERPVVTNVRGVAQLPFSTRGAAPALAGR